VGLDVYEKEASYFFKDSSSKIIQDDNLARLSSFYVFIRCGLIFSLTLVLYSNIHVVVIKLSSPMRR